MPCAAAEATPRVRNVPVPFSESGEWPLSGLRPAPLLLMVGVGLGVFPLGGDLDRSALSETPRSPSLRFQPCPDVPSTCCASVWRWLEGSQNLGRASSQNKQSEKSVVWIWRKGTTPTSPCLSQRSSPNLYVEQK